LNDKDPKGLKSIFTKFCKIFKCQRNLFMTALIYIVTTSWIYSNFSIPKEKFSFLSLISDKAVS
ncbi:hypothetical protein D3M73_10575, partial [Rodentibacter pneumotropicus]